MGATLIMGGVTHFAASAALAQRGSSWNEASNVAGLSFAHQQYFAATTGPAAGPGITGTGPTGIQYYAVDAQRGYEADYYAFNTDDPLWGVSEWDRTLASTDMEWEFLYGDNPNGPFGQGGGNYLVYDWTASEGTFMTTGTLTWYDEEGNSVASWSANSGSRSLLATPSGEWTLSNPRRRTNIRMVRDGVGFSVDIGPDGRHGRTYLRIHPDGNRRGNWQLNDGTAGCIGLTCGASGLNQFYGMIDNYLNIHRTMPLYVTGNVINLGTIEVRP